MQEAGEWRRDEIAQAKLALEQYAQRNDHIAQELGIIARDVVSAGHGRDYRSISVCFQGFFAVHMISVRVFDLRTRKAWDMICVSVFPRHPVGRSGQLWICWLSITICDGCNRARTL